MCGIFGFSSPRPTSVDWEYLSHLATVNELRGARASGILVISPQAHALLRHPTKPITVGLRTVEDQAGSRLLSSILCHSKAPTIGDAGYDETTQPVTNPEKTMILGHNGSILNWRSIDMSVPFDSPAILSAIRLPEETMIPHGLSRLDGQHACWLYLTPSKQTYLWRVMSPLFVRQRRGSTWFSSVAPPGDEGWESLKEGILYRIGPTGLVTVGAFSYSSIY